MIKNLLITKHRQIQRATAFTAALLVLVSFMVLTAPAQVGSHLKYIYLSGQLTSTNTGSPIADHEIYITSDSTENNGFGYYAVTKTDVNGFYWDTVATNNNTGVLSLYVYDFDENKIDLDRYYRFVWDTEYMMFADFEIFDPEANEELQANFLTEVQSEDEPLNIVFKDESIGTSIKSWLWDFGDGKTSTVQDPDHTYEEAGLYMVTLTINALPPEFHGFQTSTIVKQVKVGLRDYHKLGGHVFAQYFPIDHGLAYLYAIDEDNQLLPQGTAPIDNLGYYGFWAVPEGKYLVKARLTTSSALYGQFQPTYFRNAYNWNDAEEIVMNNADNFEGDIWLRPSAEIESGEGEIVGQILYDTALYSRTPIPAKDIEILLLGTEGSFYTCNLSDNNGNFSFGSIPFGTYQLFPDVTGINTSAMYVTVSEENPQIQDLSMVIYPAEITFSINEHRSDFVDNAMLLYPNPVRNQARISLDVKKASTVDCMITDLSGRMIYTQKRYLQKGMQELIISVSDLPAGVYQFTLVPEDKVMISAKFLKSN